MRRLTIRALCGAAGVWATVALSTASAVNGTWNTEFSGDWETDTNWVGNVVADGAGSTASFTQPDLTFPISVNLFVPRTIGNLTFGDLNPSTGLDATWELIGSALTLDGGTPTITVNAMNPGGAAVIHAPLGGTLGFVKNGPGQLTLGAAAHTITGPIQVNQGTLRLDAEVGGATPTGTPINLANGTTIAASVNMNALTGRTFNVASGSTVNMRIFNSIEVGKFIAAGATLNTTIETAGGQLNASGDWNVPNNASGSPTAWNVSAPNGGFLTMTYNNNSANLARNFDTAALIGTALTLDNTTYYSRTSSGGNTIQIGSIAGNATAIWSGGGGTGGTVARYQVGALNTNTTFAGNIDTLAAPTPNPGTNQGGMDLIKVGTGTLTLSGTLSYSPTQNTDQNRRGGITTIDNGVLKLTGPATLPAGTTNGVDNFMSTVRINATGTLDVSGTASPYSTAALQQVVGAGKIVGNYNHDEGLLAPGDRNSAAGAISGSNATLQSAAGTLTFQNNLSFAGSGAIRFDLSPSLASGNDKIMVGGVTTLTGTPTLTFNLLGGVTTGTYTVLESAGGFVGNTSGWTVNLGGRGAATPLTVNGNLLQLAVSASNFGNLNWSGAADSTWVAGAAGPQNWHNNGTNTADRFFDFDTVTFADTYGAGNTAVVNSAVTLNTSVSPLGVTVNSSAVSYNFSGSGKITGAATFTKSGSSTVVMNLANDFTGAAAINGGTVDVANRLNALGTGQLTLNNGMLTGADLPAGTLSNSSVNLPAGATGTFAVTGTVDAAVVLPTITGDGTLKITSSVPPGATTAGKTIDLPSITTTGANAFTGDLVIGNPGDTTTAIVRTNGAGGSLPQTLVTLNGASSLRDRATSETTVTLGGLQGDAASTLFGYQGGSGARQRTWAIGALNTDTTFAGAIVDGDGSGTTVAPTHIVKIGDGTLTLSGANTYTGDTLVQDGVLRFTSNSLSSLGDVSLYTGGVLNLDTGGAQSTIDQLFLDGVAKLPGIYGATGSGAQFETPLITGSGSLVVIGYRLPGDFDGSGLVDDADLALWRARVNNADGGDLDADANGDNNTDGTDFLLWQRHYGQSFPVTGVASAVPEPGSALLMGLALAPLAAARRRRSR